MSTIKRDTIDMAREAGLLTWLNPPEDVIDRFKAFEALVRADERAASVQEPVAWLIEFENGEQELHFDKQSVGETQAPLYTTPPAQPAPVQEPDYKAKNSP